MRRRWMSMAANVIEEITSSFSSINIKRGEDAAATATLAQGSTMPLPRPPPIASASSGPRPHQLPGPPSETRREEGHGGRGWSRFSRSKAGKGEGATTTSHDESSAGAKGSGDDGGNDDEQQGGKKPARRTKKISPVFGRDVEGLKGYRRIEVHVPDCACREAFWLSSLPADDRGYIAAATEGPPGSRSAKAVLVLPSVDHSLEGEKDVLSVLLAKGINRTRIKPARCARLSTAESPGRRREPSFLHGAVYILGEAPHLASLADSYGFRKGLGGEKDDLACCLLVAPLPADLIGATKEIMATEVRTTLLKNLTSEPMVRPKDRPSRVDHHLSTILKGLSGPLIIRSIVPHRVSLREPALLAMAQEWPEKYTIDVFGGKRELGESSLEAAIRETKEESGKTLALEDTRCFTRIPGLDLRDNSMAFFAFLYRGEQVKARRPRSMSVEEQAVEGSSGIRTVKSNQYLRELKTEEEVLVEARRPRSMSVEGRGEHPEEEVSSGIRRMKIDQYLREVDREKKVVVVGGGGAEEAGGRRGGGKEQQQQQQQQQRREEEKVLAVEDAKGGGEKRESRGEQKHDEEEMSIGVGGGKGGRRKLRAEAAPFQPASSSTSSRDGEKGGGGGGGGRGGGRTVGSTRSLQMVHMYK